MKKPITALVLGLLISQFSLASGLSTAQCKDKYNMGIKAKTNYKTAQNAPESVKKEGRK